MNRASPPPTPDPSRMSLVTESPPPTGTVLLLRTTSGLSRGARPTPRPASARPMPRATLSTLVRSTDPSCPVGVSTAIKTTSAPRATASRSVEKDSLPRRIPSPTSSSAPRLVDGYLAPPQFRHFDRVGVHDGCPVTEVGHAGAGHQAHVAGPDHADVELIQDTLPTRDRPTRRPYDGSPLPAQTKPDGGPALGPLPAAEQLDGAGLVAVPLPVHVLDLHLLTLLYVPQLGLLAVQGHLAVLGDP